MNRIIKVAALPIKEGKLLLVRSKNQQVFFTVGGKIESGETELQCLQREVKEEIGCDFINAQYFNTFEGPAHNQDKNVILICYFVELIGEPVAQSEIGEFQWWDSKSKVLLSHMLSQYILPTLASRLG